MRLLTCEISCWHQHSATLLVCVPFPPLNRSVLQITSNLPFLLYIRQSKAQGTSCRIHLDSLSFFEKCISGVSLIWNLILKQETSKSIYYFICLHVKILYITFAYNKTGVFPSPFLAEKAFH
jgi:hypothetical protein